MRKVIEKERCTACFACYNACPKKCIIQENDNNAIYPVINEEMCIDCKKCVSVCPQKNKIKTNKPIKAYAAWSLNPEIRETSSSGGIATQLYENCLKNGWLVVGTKFDENFKLNYTLTDSLEDVKKFKGSKYVQSNVNDIYIEIKEKLDKNINVLFIGLPCHVAGLKGYLNKEYNNLVTIDLICHGVSPNSYLQEHIKHIEGVTNKRADEITFREENKKQLRVYSKDEKIYEEKSCFDPYYRGFLTGTYNRESCYNCSFANIYRVSDITLGDFWGLGTEIPFNHSTEKGVSLVLINSNKGEEVINKAKEQLFLEQRTIEEATKYNNQLSVPSTKSKQYDYFAKLKKKYNFEKTAKKVFNKDIIILKIKFAIKKIIRK